MRINVIKIIFNFVILVIFLTAADHGYCGSNSAKMQVRVRVLPKVEYQVLQASSSLEITGKDQENGYKDIISGTVLSVSSNSPDGYLLSVCRQNIEAFSSVSVTVDNDIFDLPSYGCVEVYAPHSGAGEEIRRLSYRIRLQENIEKGVYPLPVAVTAYPM